jgi:ribosomal protein L7Ae-like RNA K-turn-binding protein
MQSVKVARLRVIGLKQVLRALRTNGLLRVYVAKDAAQEMLSDVLNEANRLSVPVEWVGSMRELAARFHVDVSSAAAGECRNG